MVLEAVTNRIQETIQKQGFCVVKNTSLEDALEIAVNLGNVTSSLRGGPLVDELRPVPEKEARPNSLSALYGLGSFPFHTDSANHQIPPRYLILRLADGRSSSRPTCLLDFHGLHWSADDLAVLCREVWLVNGGRGKFYTSILSRDLVPGYSILRYDLRIMRPAHARFIRSSRLLQEKIDCAKQDRIDWAAGQVLVLDNWRVLHARGTTTQEIEDRVLQRILVKMRGVTDDLEL